MRFIFILTSKNISNWNLNFHSCCNHYPHKKHHGEPLTLAIVVNRARQSQAMVYSSFNVHFMVKMSLMRSRNSGKVIWKVLSNCKGRWYQTHRQRKNFTFLHIKGPFPLLCCFSFFLLVLSQYFCINMFCWLKLQLSILLRKWLEEIKEGLDK